MSLHTDRRTFLRRSAIAAGAVWIAPVITAVPAHAAVGSDPPSPTPQTLPGESVPTLTIPSTTHATKGKLAAPAELAWTGNDQARLAALGGAAVATGAALVALNREDPREGHG